MGGKLSRREQTIMNYMENGGNMKRAMIDAGYSETYADRNSRYLMGIIGERIKTEQKMIKDDKIKTITDIQSWWSDMINSKDVSDRDRIRCSELLVKSQGGFIEKLQVDGELNNPMAGLTTEELRKLVNDG